MPEETPWAILEGPSEAVLEKIYARTAEGIPENPEIPLTTR